MTNLERSQDLHQHACDLEDRRDYYQRQGETEASRLLAEQALSKRIEYLQRFGKGMSDPPFDPKQLIL